jgi:hypothetical protein
MILFLISNCILFCSFAFFIATVLIILRHEPTPPEILRRVLYRKIYRKLQREARRRG